MKKVTPFKKPKTAQAEKERKWMEERGFEHIGKIDDFDIPKWWECAWRRVPCGKDECRLCGKIKQDRWRHIIKGEDPDDMKSVLEDVGNSFKEVAQIIKNDAERLGIDITNLKDIEEKEEPPEAEEFPLYRELVEWHKTVGEAVKSAELNGSYWRFTESVADLVWYKNTLLAKAYRQLCNRWELDRSEEFGDVDYQFTKYVLDECLKILKKSLVELSQFDSPEKSKLQRAYTELSSFKTKIMEI